MHDFILCIDIGNTNVVLGLYKGSTQLKTHRLPADTSISAQTYFDTIHAFYSDDVPTLQKVVMSSVVPTLTKIFSDISKDFLGVDIIIVSADTPLGLTYPISDPSHIGPDMIVNAYATVKKYRKNAIIIDMGTATTIQLVTADGYFMGYAILPGIYTSLLAITEKAAKLSDIPLNIDSMDSHLSLAMHTTDALTSGIILSHVFAIAGYIDMIKSDNKHLFDIVVIATGGLTRYIKPYTTAIDIFDGDLLLDGLAMMVLST
jgi:type III pantothenate kinase